MNQNELIDLIMLGHESERLEYRESMSWENEENRASLIRSILAMSHVSSGGMIVLGFKRIEDHFEPQGMSLEDKNSFSEEKLRSAVSEFADAQIALELFAVSIEDSEFLVIEVPEFKGRPILCRKDGPSGLKRGNLYWRSQDGGSVRVIENAFPFRSMLHRNLEREVLDFWGHIENLTKKTRSKASLDPATIKQVFTSQTPIETLSSADLKSYERESDRACDPPEFFERLVKTGYWTLEFRPFQYNPVRLPSMEQMKEAVADTQVTFRGVGFPPYRKTLHEYEDAIGFETEFMSLLYRWRFFQSGHLVYYLACREDYEIDKNKLAEFHIDGTYPSESYLDVLSVLYLLIEFYEFAARLAFRGLFKDGLEISITLNQAQDRQLFFWEPIWGFNEICVSKTPKIEIIKNVGAMELFRDSRELSMETCLEFFSYFHSQAISREMLQPFHNEYIKLYS